VLCGPPERLTAKGLVSWVTTQDIATVKSPGVHKTTSDSHRARSPRCSLEAENRHVSGIFSVASCAYHADAPYDLYEAFVVRAEG
jgi:hypothetical protein